MLVEQCPNVHSTTIEVRRALVVVGDSRSKEGSIPRARDGRPKGQRPRAIKSTPPELFDVAEKVMKRGDCHDVDKLALLRCRFALDPSRRTSFELDELLVTHDRDEVLHAWLYCLTNELRNSNSTSIGNIRGEVPVSTRITLLYGLLLTVNLSAADWPQWRGPNRSNVSADTGLLADWPDGGPPLVWKADGIGQGVPSVSVAGGKVFVLGYRDGKEHLTALAERDGKSIWSTPIGPEAKEQSVMRWLSQRTPTVDVERVYAFTARGELICLGTADGKEKWRKDYVKDFAGKPGTLGYCDFPWSTAIA